MFGKPKVTVEDEIITFLDIIDSKLDGILGDLQQIKTSQRASQKRERKQLKSD